MEEDAPLAIHEDITAVTDTPPRMPSQSPVADVVIDDPSTHSLGTGRIEHPPLDPTHSPYDIV